MDFLKAEIERKKRQIAEKNVMQPEKKYFKRGDLAEAQAKEYNAIHAPKMAPQPEELPDEQPEKVSEIGISNPNQDIKSQKILDYDNDMIIIV